MAQDLFDIKQLGAFLAGRELFLFMDFDGTMASLASDPEQVELPAENKELLKKLAQVPHIKVAVVSGRSLADIRKRIGLTEIFYIGNHGFEIEGPDLQLDGLLSEPVRKDFDRLKEELKNVFVGMNGVWVEDKHVTLSIHFRQADDATVEAMKKAFDKICHLYAVGEKIRVYPGNKVLEIRPPVDWDKGQAVLWFLSKQPHPPADRKVLAVCVGDDATDEDAFKAVAERGLTIRVGQDASSKAQYYLPDPRSVTQFLTAVLDVMSAPSEQPKG